MGKDRVAAGTQQENFLQLDDRRVDRRARDERTEVASFGTLFSAMLDDLRKGMVATQQDGGKAFVVAQKNVVAWLECLDEGGFGQQGFGFGWRDQKFETARCCQHALQAIRQPKRTRVGLKTFFQVARFADIERLSFFVQHAIAARSRGCLRTRRGDDGEGFGEHSSER